MRVGIIKLSALGDIIVAMSFLPALKAQLNCEIDWFVDTRFKGILQNSPYISHLYSLPIKGANWQTLKHIIKLLKELEEYDLLIDMQGLLKSAILGSFIPSKVFRGFGFFSIKEKWASVFYNQKICIDYEENILKRNAKILDLDMPIHPRNAFCYTPQAKKRVEHILRKTSTYVLLVLEASKPQKIYPIKQYARVCQMCKNQEIEFLILWHAHLKEAQELAQESGATLLPKLSLDEVKALVDKVDLVIGGDTGITHLAWAMQKPSITLYGNTPLARFELKGEYNFSLSANPYANYKKNDFSIGDISPQCIAQKTLEILR